MDFNKNTYSVTLQPDEEGMIGRQCRREECKKYFKIDSKDCGEFQNIEMYCPYCGSKEFGNNFYTEDQLKYATSVITADFMGGINKQMKKLEQKPDPHAFISIGVTYTPGKIEIRKYVEKDLKTKINCEKCDRSFALYSVSSFCPFCGKRDDKIIYDQNIQVVKKFINLQDVIPEKEKEDLTEHGLFDKLVEKSLDMLITAFETFCKSKYLQKELILASKSEKEVLSIVRNSFQNLKEGNKLMSKYGVNFYKILSKDEKFVSECFEKRHVLIHNSGIIDQKFIERTNSDVNLLGKRVIITKQYIERLIVNLDGIILEIEQKLK